MTNINCSSDCIYQKDGNCTLESVTLMAVTTDNSCAYYQKRKTQQHNKAKDNQPNL
ncbi:MAG: hypothetical protein GX800_03265 [Clostridiaceae bacterium]|jgi:hypothetical protein|nr:hypothetical protein [Clostridiaceae bacterium]